MSVLPIVIYDDEVLREETKPVTNNSEELQTLIDDMFDTMYNADGVGLAAPQIGRSLRLFVADASPFYEEENSQTEPQPVTMINPKVTIESDQTVTMDEGCLSIPDIMGPVARPEKVGVEFKDRHFNDRKVDVDGPLARVIQHEIDHLDGVLFIDHLSFFKRKLVSSKLKMLANGEKQIEYPAVEKPKQKA